MKLLNCTIVTVFPVHGTQPNYCKLFLDRPGHCDLSILETR